MIKPVIMPYPAYMCSIWSHNLQRKCFCLADVVQSIRLPSAWYRCTVWLVGWECTDHSLSGDSLQQRVGRSVVR